MLHTEFKFGEVVNLAGQVSGSHTGVQHQNIFGNPHGGVSLLAFETGQQLSEHLSPAQLMVYVVEGEITFTMINEPHTLRAGQFILLGEGVPHSVIAHSASKVMLVKIKG